MLTCSSSGRPVSVCGRRSGDPTPGSVACCANAVFFNQLRPATVAAGARAAIESAAAAAFGAGIFFDSPQKAGAGADRTVISGHDAMGTVPEVSAVARRRAIPFSGYTPFAGVARDTTRWHSQRREDGPKELAWNLFGRWFREAHAAAFAGFADAVQLDGLRAAGVAGRAIAAGNSTDAAAVGAGRVFGAAHKPDALAAGTVPDRHTCCIQRPGFLRNRLARKSRPRTSG
jgi:hypothetical protein